MTLRFRHPALLLAAITLVCTAVAARLLPRALPTVGLDQRMSRPRALQRADSFFRAHGLAPDSSRVAVRFRTSDSLLTYIELGAGGKDTLEALVRSQDVPLFTWSVRAFVPNELREAEVTFAPDGRIIGFRRTLPEAEARPPISEDSAVALARHVLSAWLPESPARWRLLTTSYETRRTSGRIDRTVTFERIDRRVGDAPIRLAVVIAGDLPINARPDVPIPETFRRRYGAMRSANALLSLLASVGILGIALVGAAAVRPRARQSPLRWRPAMAIGTVVGALLAAAVVNELSASWYDYDTATSPVLFQVGLVASAVLLGGVTVLLVALTLAVAERLARSAFPAHVDWWKLWAHRGTRDVAFQVAGGYTTAAFAFAYVALFYAITRQLFGWWVPSTLLDDPNQIATPLPWLAGAALSLQAAVWEEALFRAVPLSVLSLWVGDRPRRGLWLGGGVVATALVFGFAHASYPSWPPYSRGVEIFLDACLWGALFLRFGLLVTVIAHFVYDLVLFGLFAAAGTALPYRVTAIITLLILLAPALAVAWRWWRQGVLLPLPDEARFRGWVAAPRVRRELPRLTSVAGSLARPAARMAVMLSAVAVVVVLARPEPPTLGPSYTATRAGALATADAALQARGVETAAWLRLSTTATDTLGEWRGFLRQHDSTQLATRLAGTYMVPTWWIVRYVRTDTALARRAEEWRVRVFPDGRLLDVRHLVPEDEARPTPEPGEARRVAQEAIGRAGLEAALLVESRFDVTARPARRDITVTYTDTSVHLPAGARARVWVALAGDEVVSLRRGIELPEEGLRAQRRREQQRFAAAGASGIAGLVLVATMCALVVRRRPVLVFDTLGRRTIAGLLAVLAGFQLAEALLGLPGVLLRYDTAVPWDRFAGETALGLGLSLVGVFMLAALWLLVHALRRRVGISIPAGEGGAPPPRDVALAGLGLASVLVLVQQGLVYLLPSPIPPAPSTLLDQAVPVLAHAAAAIGGPGLFAPIVAIPVLAAIGTARSRAHLWSLIALLLACGLGVVWSTAAMGGLGGFRAVLAVLVAAAAFGTALRAWGAVSVATWVVAGLVMHGLEALRLVARAPTSPERLAGVVSVAVTVALLGVTVTWVRRHGAPSAPPAQAYDRQPAAASGG